MWFGAWHCVRALVLTQVFLLAKSGDHSTSNVTTTNPLVVNEGVGWRVVVLQDVPFFLIHEGYEFSSHPENRVVGKSVCPHTEQTQLASEEVSIPVDMPSRTVMLKLATTGSSWIGNLIKAMPNVHFETELISGSRGQYLTDKEKESIMMKALGAPCTGKVLCGFSINSKNAANLDFQKFAAQQASMLSHNDGPSLSQIAFVKVVVWIRSNTAAHTVGMWRSRQLISGPCKTNNVKSKDAAKCALPSVNVTIPLDEFKGYLRAAQFFEAVNLGSAYRHWKAHTREGEGSSCGNEEGSTASNHESVATEETIAAEHVPIYEMYYEDMLRDKQNTFQALLAWLQMPGRIPQAEPPADKTVKSTPASLQSLLKNFAEIRSWLVEHAPCLVPHLDSDGTEVMAPCPLHFILEKEQGLFENAARRKIG